MSWLTRKTLERNVGNVETKNFEAFFCVWVPDGRGLLQKRVEGRKKEQRDGRGRHHRAEEAAAAG